MLRYLILACFALVTVGAEAEEDTASPQAPPLTDIIDASRGHLDAARFVGQFNSLCRIYGKEAFDEALAPFKDLQLLNKATENGEYYGIYHGEIQFFLARVFWQGLCVERDEAAAFTMMTDQAYLVSASWTESLWERRAEVSNYLYRTSRQYARPEDQVGRSFTDWDIPPWTERMIPIGDQAQSFRPIPLFAEDQVEEAAQAAANGGYGIHPVYDTLPPIRRELGRAYQIAEQGFDAPLSVALILRHSGTALAGQNSLAKKWLKIATEEPFEHPYAFHFQALWHRDRVFSALLARETGEWDRTRSDFSRMWVDAYTANEALSRALEVGDTSLLPLAYCLMDYQLWDQSAESNLRRAGESYNNMFEGRDDLRAERLAFQYETMLLMEDQGQKLPEDELEKVSNEISFLKRMAIRLMRDISGLDLDPKLLPEEAIDLTACAARTGQTDFWQEMGLLDAPEKYWLGKEVADAAFKTDLVNGLVPLEQLFNPSRYTADWTTFTVRLVDYCETYDPTTMDKYLSPFKDPETRRKSYESDFLAEHSDPIVRTLLAGLYGRGTCVPQDMDFARSVDPDIGTPD